MLGSNAVSVQSPQLICLVPGSEKKTASEKDGKDYYRSKC